MNVLWNFKGRCETRTLSQIHISFLIANNIATNIEYNILLNVSA